LLIHQIVEEGKAMTYIKAQNVLPQEIINLIQEYVDGECLYIPRKSGKEKSWGEKNGTRKALKCRDIEIFNNYVNGATIIELTKMYYLSDKSIRRIINKEKSSRM
jgi:Mor family transcriptional regulator